MLLTILMALFLGQSLQAAEPVQQTMQLVASSTISQDQELSTNKQNELIQVEPEAADELIGEQEQQRPADISNAQPIMEEETAEQTQEQMLDESFQTTPEESAALTDKKKAPHKSVRKAKKESIGIIRLFEDVGSNDEDIIKKIIAFSQDSTVKGVLLLIDSYGGSIGSSELLFREIKELSKEKPVVALVINNCCSGAYWMATACDWIIAPASSDIGSIGVKYTIEKCKNYKQTGQDCTADMDITIICAGKFKGISDARTAPLNDEERAYIQEGVNQQYETFVSFVAQARNLSLEKILEWADGKRFTGVQALKLGLIDQIGGYSDAIKKLKQLIQEREIIITQELSFVE